MAPESARTDRLEEARFKSILRDSFGFDTARLGDVEISRFPFGIAARHGDHGWVVSSSPDPAMLGGVLVWAGRVQVSAVDLVVEHHAGVHARRTSTIAPELTVWALEGASLRAVEPDPLGAVATCPAGLEDFERTITRAGATVVREDGILRAEVCGLEVGRVVVGAGGSTLEAGVGRFDREAGALLHVGRDPFEALAAVVAQVEPHRRPAAPPHPIGRLARGRWLRSLILETPSLAGLSDAEPVEPIPVRASLLEDVPGVLLGRDADRSVLVACSVGVDLGLVPEVADQIIRHRPDEVRLVLPPRDRVAAMDALCARLAVPVTYIDLAMPWSPFA